MDRPPRRSFATRLVVAYVGAAVVLMLLIGGASSLFTFRLYAQTSNEIVARATRQIEARIARSVRRHEKLDTLAHRLTADLGRPRIHVAVYTDEGQLLSESGPATEPNGFVGAVASLMGLQSARVPVPGGFVSISADLGQLSRTLWAYWLWMLPVGVIAVGLAWAAGVAITRQATAPLTQMLLAMRRLAAGDFRPEPVRSAGEDELGELAHAYNGALHQVQSALAQRDRSESEIRQFIADAGHELRTPLTVVMGYLDVLEDAACEAPAVRQRVIASMRQESRRMRALIEKLIYLARLERGEPAARHIVDISEVVAQVIASMPEPKARINVMATPNARVIADEADIAEAIRNLVDNALKYAPAGEIAVISSVCGDEVLLVVRDHGPGMSEHDRAHAFDRFYRGGGVAETDGSGIGLAIVKRATERSGGSVSVESREGEGAAFTIRLPRAVA